MRNKGIFIKRTAFVICLLSMPCFVGAEGNLDFNISTAKQEFVIGEPVFVCVKLHNSGNQAVEFMSNQNLITLSISKDKENFIEYQGSEILISIVIPKILPKLKPGETWTGNLFVLYNFRRGEMRMAFPEQGRYFFKGVYTFRDTKSESNLADIEIKEPQGLDLSVWKTIKEIPEEYAKFLQNGYASKAKEEEVVNRLKEIIGLYPTSVYTPHIKEALIKYYRTKPVETKEEARKRDEYLKTLEKDKP